MQPPHGREPFDHDQAVNRSLDPVGVVDEVGLVELMDHSIAIPFWRELVLGAVLVDPRVVHDPVRVADQAPVRVVEWNGDAAGHEPPGAVAEAEVPDSSGREPSTG